MKKEILFVLYSLIIGTASAQYNIDLSKVVSPPINYLQMGNAGPVGKEIASIIYIWKKGASHSCR